VPDTATAADLGITALVSSGTTTFAGSSEERRINIGVAASRFDGLVISPGQEFSFNEYLGDVTQETGFEQALIIYNGRTIEGVGGGVCQVSTTAFQAAFYAGFPIHERWPHGYWVGYYNSGEGKGMDATVYSPLVDLRFTNDTPYHLLIETETDLRSLSVTFRFYSTSDGRTVQKDGPYIENVVPHGPPLYEESADLRPGQIKQVDYAVDGFDATVYRTVYRDGQLLYQDTFFSQYMPWRAIYQVAPGEVPAGAARTDG
jgi:vancomycin resistance protein YoaR